MNEADLPLLWETKHTLGGREKRFACRVLETTDDGVVVLFVAPAAMHVHGIDLPAGTVTFGHFWLDRPYNVYHWLDEQGQTLGHYFNLSEATTLGPKGLSWRDLVVDVLIRPGSDTPEILDAHELDDLGASESDRAAARHAEAQLLADLPALRQTLSAAQARLWPRCLAWQAAQSRGGTS